MPDGNATHTVQPSPTTLASQAAGAPPSRKKLLLGFTALLAVIAGAGTAYWTLVASNYVSTDNAYVGASPAPLNAQVPGTIATVLVDNTDMVRKGDVLATIDQADVKLVLARAEAEYRRTVQRVSQYFAQESAARALVAARRADLDRAKDEYDRRRGLGETGAVSAQEYKAAESAFNAARANLVAAEEGLVAAIALTRDLTVETHPETAAAQAALATAQLDLARTTIRAPIDGVIAHRNAQIGQRVQPGAPLMAVVPIQAAYVDANFKEIQLAKVRPGQAVELISDMYGDSVTYNGRVVGFAGGTGAAFAIVPAQNATGNWIKVVQRLPVRIALEPSELAAHPLRVGVSMTATIDTRG